MTNTILRFRFAFSLVAVCSAVTVAGCASPLASRRARVLEPGEVEVTAAPYMELSSVAADHVSSDGSSTLGTAPIAFPMGEASVRFGLLDRTEMQIKIDPTVVPEVSLAYQLVGDPAKNDFAFTISAGLKPGIALAGDAGGGVIATPVEAIVDLPFGEKDALVLGTRIIPGYTFDASGSELTVSPGAFAALHFQLGSLFVRPEIAVNHHFAVSHSADMDVPLNGTTVVAALDVGMIFDFRSHPPMPPSSVQAPPTPMGNAADGVARW